MRQMKKQQGMVSIIVLMFTIILLSIVSTSFIRLMVQGESRASDNNLSRAAYESATAGVEDGKRVISACQKGDRSACNAISAGACTTVQDAGIISSADDTAVTIKSGSSSTYISGQAYTCVVINTKTSDITYDLQAGVSKVIPLKISGGSATKVHLQWLKKTSTFTSISNPASGYAIDSLPKQSDWAQDAPALMRVQLIIPSSGSASLSSLDGSGVSTRFLRPSVSATAGTSTIGSVSRSANSSSMVLNSVAAVQCSSNAFNNGQYACSADVTLPSVLNSGNSMAYVRLTSIYNNTNVRLSFDTTSSSILFDGVQPKVDSTGRAGDIYRRVSSRVSVQNDEFNLPEYAVDITGSLCKNFSVTDTSGQQNSTSCTTSPEEQ